MTSDAPVTQDPPPILAANARKNVAALAMAPLPEGAGSHAPAEVHHLASTALSTHKANHISGSGHKKRRGTTRTYKRSRKDKQSSRKGASKKRRTKRKSSRSSRSSRSRRSNKSKK